MAYTAEYYKSEILSRAFMKTPEGGWKTKDLQNIFSEAVGNGHVALFDEAIDMLEASEYRGILYITKDCLNRRATT